MTRHDDFELWHEVNRTIIGLTGVVEMFAKRVRRADRLDLAREFIAHSDELEARAERQTDEVAAARLEGQVQGWWEAAARLRTRRTCTIIAVTSWVRPREAALGPHSRAGGGVVSALVRRRRISSSAFRLCPSRSSRVEQRSSPSTPPMRPAEMPPIVAPDLR